MSVRAKCPHCEYTFALHERALGRSLACPSCQHEIKLPSKEEVEVAKAKKAAQKRQSPVLAPRTPTLKARTVGAAPGGAPVEAVAEPARKPRKRKKKHAVNHEEAWDITPMVDVAFLLLIFFMVTNSFSIQKVIRTARQLADKASTNAVQVESQEKVTFVTVQVDEQDGFSVVLTDGSHQDAFSKQDLILILTGAKEEGGEDLTDLTVEAHEDSTHGAVVAALDAGRAANFSKFKTTVVEEFE